MNNVHSYVGREHAMRPSARERGVHRRTHRQTPSGHRARSPGPRRRRTRGDPPHLRLRDPSPLRSEPLPRPAPPRGHGTTLLGGPVIAVVGAGLMGAATAWELARRGHEVTLVEAYGIGHRH